MAETTAVALASVDPDLRQRIGATAAMEGFTDPGQHPLTWADVNQWFICAEPGIGEAYASALAGENPRPGWDLSVITDGMLLAAATAVYNENHAEDDEEEI